MRTDVADALGRLATLAESLSYVSSDCNSYVTHAKGTQTFHNCRKLVYTALSKGCLVMGRSREIFANIFCFKTSNLVLVCYLQVLSLDEGADLENYIRQNENYIRYNELGKTSVQKKRFLLGIARIT